MLVLGGRQHWSGVCSTHPSFQQVGEAVGVSTRPHNWARWGPQALCWNHPAGRRLTRSTKGQPSACLKILHVCIRVFVCMCECKGVRAMLFAVCVDQASWSVSLWELPVSTSHFPRRALRLQIHACCLNERGNTNSGLQACTVRTICLIHIYIWIYMNVCIFSQFEQAQICSLWSGFGELHLSKTMKYFIIPLTIILYYARNEGEKLRGRISSLGLEINYAKTILISDYNAVFITSDQGQNQCQIR